MYGFMVIPKPPFVLRYTALNIVAVKC